MSHSDFLLSALSSHGEHPMRKHKALWNFVCRRIGETFRDACVADFSEYSSNNVVPHQLLRTVSEMIVALDKPDRILFNSHFLRGCLEAHADNIETEKLFADVYPPRDKWFIREDGNYCYYDPRYARPIAVNAYIVNLDRGKRLARRYSQVVSRRIREDIFSENTLEKRHELAQESYAILGHNFIEYVLQSPEKIRGLIKEFPDRGTIAYGYLLASGRAALRI
jgi:hypothetical protein